MRMTSLSLPFKPNTHTKRLRSSNINMIRAIVGFGDNLAYWAETTWPDGDCQKRGAGLAEREGLIQAAPARAQVPRRLGPTGMLKFKARPQQSAGDDPAAL